MRGAAGQQRVPQEYLANLMVPVPPQSEQQAIAEFIADQLNTQDKILTNAKQELKLVREYHNRIIADVVTGKLDVREASAKLPDELEDSTVPDEEEVMEDAEALDEEPDVEFGGVDPIVKTPKRGQVRCDLPFSEIRSPIHIRRRRGCGNVGNGGFPLSTYPQPGQTATGWKYMAAGVW
jgi:hypothetical protein